MGAQKHGSKGSGGGGYVGGFLHLFDWNAKSRKKLFSSKSESPEQPKQTKRTDGNMPMTRFNTMDEDDMIGGLSLKGSSDYSCATSVTDEDGYGTKAPGVVARLMGLDSLPTFNFSDTYSNPSFDSQSLRDSSQFLRDSSQSLRDSSQSLRDSSQSLRDSTAPYIRKFPEFEPNDCEMEDVPRATKPKPQKTAMSKAIEKFQTETLPPKSAKSFPVNRNKLLSPIKNSGFVSSSNPARIAEAASKIPLVGPSSSSPSPSSFVPFKLNVSREKIENSTRKPKLPESSRRPLDSNAAKNLKSQQSSEPKKSISLALQAKANVQKREGLNHRAQSVRTQPNTDRNPQRNPGASNVLKQNNQKQNSLVDRGKSTPKPSCSTVGQQPRKTGSQKSSSKISENSKTSHKKEPYSVTTRRKRSMEDGDRTHAADKNVVRDRSYRSNSSDVVSFTFTAPIARPPISTNGFLTNNQSKNMLDSTRNASSSSLSYNVIGGDALSTLLEQKLRELTGNPATGSQDSFPATESDVRDDSSYGFSSFDPLQQLTKKHHKPDQGRDGIARDDSSYGFSSNDPMELMKKHHKLELCVDMASESSSDDCEYRKLLRGRQPSPSSVLEPSFLTESCNSSDTADSCKQSSASVLAQELVSATFLRKSSPMEIDTELSDSASSATNCAKWEADYVKEVLSDIENMFVDFSLGKSRKIVNPRVFDRLEFGRPNQEVAKLRRELVFNCVSECMETKCRVWGKRLAVVSRPDKLAEEVYREIVGWEEMKDGMVDELVDKDMSGDGYKKWLDYDVELFEIGVEIERRLLDSLINEVVDDILVL
ncbi:hypothetical protein OSB04_009785 [Centaurea solstitialis]|uniref:DUF4378 domain-containing protein n=1 Tax=Centaurea solstitialis TaxID=347529 RepID=A0AA38WNP1_9ASTR|nr:hypothetical protein OSB04_009785 [Centaurea solstitialis]